MTLGTHGEHAWAGLCPGYINVQIHVRRWAKVLGNPREKTPAAGHRRIAHSLPLGSLHTGRMILVRVSVALAAVRGDHHFNHVDVLCFWNLVECVL